MSMRIFVVLRVIIAPVIQASQHWWPTGISMYSKPAFSAAMATRSNISRPAAILIGSP